MHITGTHLNYYFICHRKLWLFANGINMESTSDLVYEGKLIHESTYPARSDRFREVAIGPVKIDYYDPKEKIVHEIKKSSKMHDAHVWQIKYYLHLLKGARIEGATGFLEYPKERRKEEIFLSERDEAELEEILINIDEIIHSKKTPGRIQVTRCKKCSYYDFCYVGEEKLEI